MNNEERILKYFSDELSFEEKKLFEADLEDSEELQREYYLLREKLTELKENAVVAADDSYFSNLVPIVRSKMELRNNYFTFPRLALTLSVLAVLYIVSFNILDFSGKKISFTLNDKSPMLNEALEDATDDQLSEYIDINLNYSGNSFSVITDGLEITSDNLEGIGESALKSFDEYELLNKLNEDEVNEIYNKLLNKKIL